MKRTIIAQILASTAIDLQREQFSVDGIHSLLQGMPARMPLHQHHNFQLPVCGEMTNFRIQDNPDDPSHVMLVCDVTYDDELIDGGVGSFGGFSFSAFCNLESYSTNPEICIYLPFPFYNDQAIVESLKNSDESIAVGRWLKKGVGTTLVAMAVFLAKPLWDTIYKETLEKHVKRLIARIKDLWPTDVEVNCEVEVPIALYQPRPKVIFLPSPPGGIETLTSVPDAVEAAKRFCEADFWNMGKRIDRLLMTLDIASGRFIVQSVQYLDGTHKSFS